MLRHIHIQNFAIIDEIELNFQSGKTALTGETGAGKSILLDALGLVMGDRADSKSVGPIKDSACITAVYDIQNTPQANQWLNEQDLDSDDECVMRRVIKRDGKSKAYINGTPVTLQSLRALGELLIDIHGQHEHQSLLKRDVQRQRLDDYADHENTLTTLKTLFLEWQSVNEQLIELQTAEKERQDKLDMLRYQVQEFDNLNLQANEWDELDTEHKRAAHSGKLLNLCQQVFNDLYENDELTIYSKLSQHLNAIGEVTKLDPSLKNVEELLNSSLIQIREAADVLRDYVTEIDIDPNRLEWLEQRIGAIYDLARKHHTEPNTLYELSESLRNELDTLIHADDNILKLQTQEKELSEKYLQCATKLSNSRIKTAKELSTKVTAAMQELGMQGGKFIIRVEKKSVDKFSIQGLDDITFQVTANPGQPEQALSKVASGGELSRISLAIQMITATSETIPTLIFDEVDAGIGGGTAEVVGKHLRELGNARQVICVTHLPQVASQAHHHLRVSKHTEVKGGSTRTTIETLDDSQRINEIARMLGGVEITDTTVHHAEEMIKKAAC